MMIMDHVPRRTSRGLKRACCISARSAASSALWRVAAEAYGESDRWSFQIISTCSLSMAMPNNSMNINDYNLKTKFSIVQQPNLMFTTVHCYLSDFLWHCCGSLCRSWVPIPSIDAFILKITDHLGVFESWVYRYTGIPVYPQNGSKW